MYTNYFGLRLTPFEDRADPQFTFSTSELEETLAALEYEAHYDHGMALVVGEAGVGKTQLIRALLAQLHTTDHIVVVTRPAGGELDVVRESCKGFGVSLASGSQDGRQLARLRRHLARNTKADHCSVLIVDHAEHLTTDELEQLAALNDLRETTVRLLTVILTGQPRVLQTLKEPGLEKLEQRLFHKRRIGALSAEETVRYIRHRLRVAGAVDVDIFDADAITMIHAAAGGVPRLINRVCHSAMVAAYGADTRRIHTGIVSEILGSGEVVKERSADAAAVTARDTTAQCTQDPIERGTIPEQVGSVETDSTSGWLRDDAHSEMNGSIAGGAYVEHRAYDGAFAAAGGDDGYAMVDRLERCMSHAERICATTDAKLAQFSAIDKHLASLSQSAERLISGLSQGVRQAGHSCEQIQNRMDATLADAERRINDIDARATRALEVGKNLSGKLVHVETECDRAKEVSTRLGAFADQLADSVDDMQSRTAPLLDTIHSAEELEHRLTATCQRAAEAATQVEAQFQVSERKFRDRINELQQRAHRVTTETIEQIERTVTETDASLTSTISDAEQRSQNAARALQGEVERVTTEAVERSRRTIGDADASLASAIAGAEKRTRDAANEAQRATTETIEQIQRTVVATEASLTSTIGGAEQLAQNTAKSLQGEVKRITTEAVERTQRTISEAEAAMTSAIASAEQRTQDAAKEVQRVTTESAERSKRTISEAEAQITSTAAGAEQRAQDAARALQSVIESSESRHENLRESTETLIERVGNASLQVGHLSETAKSVGNDASALVECVTKVSNEAAPLIDRVEKVIDRVNSAHIDAETLRRTVTERLVDIGRACEQTEQLNQQTEFCKQAVDHVLGNREWLEHLVDTLSTKTKNAELCVKAFDTAEERISEIKSAVASVQTAGGEIDKVRGVTEHLIAHADETKRALVDVLESSQERFRMVNESIDSGSNVAAQLTDLNKVAAELHDAMQGLVAHADEKIGRLDSHSAAAGRILREICEANEQGQAIVDQTETQITKSQELAGDAFSKIEGLSEDISSLTSKSETSREQLAEELDGAREVLDKIRTVAEPARQAAAKLAEQVTKASDVSAVITEQTTSAREQLAGLNGLAPLLDTIKETDESVRMTAEEIKQAREELLTVLEDAALHTTNLDALNMAASTLIETQRQLAERMENMTQRFDDKIADTKTAMVTGEELLGEFIAQGDTINERLTQLAKQAEAISQRVDGKLGQPEAIIARAKAQGEQLEKVCAAVRKVFAGLSQATLEAREQTDELRNADNSSTEQLATLTTRTQQAAAVLQDWVEQAVQVQARLERSLGRCPTIQQTHQGAHATELGKVVSAPTKSVRTLDGERAALGSTTETGTGASPIAQKTTATSSPRAKDIARMIAEAKQAKTAGTT